MLFAPLSLIYRAVIFLRKKAYQTGLLSSTSVEKPVVVVGNITVGGTGKTPLIKKIARDLQLAGYSVGIISRGYLSKAPNYPYWVNANSPSEHSGDEALEIHLATGLPVVIAPKRVEALQALIKKVNVDVVLADDGLQHYALKPSLRIGVVDGIRRFGNGWCLPVGPCREPKENWYQLEVRVCNGFAEKDELQMQLHPKAFVNLKDSKMRLPLDAFISNKVQVVSAIGHPERFLNTLNELKMKYESRLFEDHHRFAENDFRGLENHIVVMTEKDATKCRQFARDNWWYLAVEAEYDNQLLAKVQEHIAGFAKSLI